MKIKDGFVLRTVAGSNVVVPTGDRALDFNGVITLNNSGMFLWKLLETETDETALADALMEEYKIDEALARESVSEFVAKLKENDFLA